METLNTIERITLIISVSVVALIHLSIAMDKFKMKLNLKRFSKISLIMLFIVSSFLMKSQDTIYFKNKTTVAAKITEVGISEIKYQRLDNLTGPNYLSSKTFSNSSRQLKKFPYWNDNKNLEKFLLDRLTR